MADSLRRPEKKSLAKTPVVVLIAFAAAGFLASLAVHTGFLASVAALPSASFHLLWITLHLIILAIWWLSDAAPRDESSRHQELALFISPAVLSSPPSSATYTPPEAWHDVVASPGAVEFGGGDPPTHEEPAAVPAVRAEEKERDEYWESAAVATTAEEEEEDGESLDDTWRSIMDERGAVAAPVLRKSETWERVRRDEAAAAEAVEVDRGRRQMRKSETFKEGRPAARRKEEGWRRREELVVGSDELSRKVETFIKKHYDHLRLQRQESEHRRSLERLQRCY